MRRLLTKRSAPFALTGVCFLVGLLLAAQLQTQSRSARFTAGASGTDQAAIVSSLYENNLMLRKEVAELQGKLQEHERSLSQSDLDAMVHALNEFRLVNGMSEVAGPGAAVTISGSIRPQDLLDLVNELRNAGAEAIAVNDERISVRSAFSGDSRQVTLNGRALRAPYMLRAVGHSDTLERALLRKGGLVAYLESTYPGLRAQVVKQERVTVPVYRDGYAFRFAKEEQ